MSRRNTIIIAVLVNAGLLLVLFATAMRSNDKKEESPIQLADVSKETKDVKSEAVTTEELLNEYIAKAPTVEQEEIVMVEELTLPTTANQPEQETIISAMPAMEPVPVTQQKVEQKPVVVQAPVTTAPVQKEIASEVVVKKGDYLEKIAKANNTTVNALMKANNLSSTQLKIGQVLKLPGKGSDNKPTQSQAPAANEFYIVKEGDNPWMIASKCHVKLDELLRLNNIDEQKAKKLRPGDKLRIR